MDVRASAPLAPGWRWSWLSSAVGCAPNDVVGAGGIETSSEGVAEDGAPCPRLRAFQGRMQGHSCVNKQEGGSRGYPGSSVSQETGFYPRGVLPPGLLEGGCHARSQLYKGIQRACRWHAWRESSRQIKPAGVNCLKATIRWASLGRHVWGLHVLE